LPGAFVAIISLIFLASESLRFNILILKKIYFNQDKNDIFFFDYIKKIAISGIILIIAAFFDSCLITGLANFFDF
jgi:hypothetical protein